MKKLFIILFITIIFGQFGYCSNSPISMHSIARDLKDAVVTDVTNSVNATVNSVKLAGYQAQLEKKKNELKEVENSSSSVFVKNYKKIRLKQQISELEDNIRRIESEM